MKKTKKTGAKLKDPVQAGDLFITKRLLDLTEKRLSKEITSLRIDVKSETNQLEKRMSSRIDDLESRISLRMDKFEFKVNSQMNHFESKISLSMDQFELKVSSRMDQLESGMSSRIDNMDIRMDNIESNIEKMAASLFRMEALVEEQNIRNIAVLDGYTSLYDHHVLTSQRLNSLEKAVFGKEQK